MVKSWILSCFVLLLLVSCGRSTELSDSGTGDADTPRDSGPDTSDTGVDTSDTGVDADTSSPDSGGLLERGARCNDDAECSSGLCYGEADATSGFLDPTCQAQCINLGDRRVYCTGDSQCCEGTCCLGCGEREGVCLTR